MSWLERRFGKFAIRNLPLYLTVLTAIVSGYAVFTNADIGELSIERIVEGQWYNILLFPFRVNTDMMFFGPKIGLFLTVLVIFFFGRTIEFEMGYSRFNAYVLSGFVIFEIGALFFSGISIHYLYFVSMMLAVTYIAPQTELYIFMILPVRIVWLSVLVIGGMAFLGINSAIAIHSIQPLMGLILSGIHWMIFFGPQILREKNRALARRVKKVETIFTDSIHRCAVCGITEKENPHMDFRFCVDCDDHEYCVTHLHDHTHVKSDRS